MRRNYKRVYIFFTLFYAYFILALFECARGNFIPFFINEFSINNTSVSIIVSISQFGCVIGNYLAGSISQRYNQKLTLVIGTLICSIVALSSSLISNAVMLCLFYLIFNVGRSFLCVSVDSTIPTISFGYEIIFINLAHFMYGIGSFTGQRALSALLSKIVWQNIYFYVGILFVTCTLFALFIFLPKANYVNDKSLGLNKKSVIKNPISCLLIICLSFSCLGEGMMTTWFVNYISSCYSLSAQNSASFSSLFFITFAIGRLFGGIVLKRVGNLKGLKISMFCASTLLLVGLLLQKKGLYLISLTGLFMSINYPSLMVVISEIFKEYTSYAIGIMNTFNAIIYIIFTVLIGILNDSIGLYATFYLSVIFMAIAGTMLLCIEKHKKNSVN